MYLKKLRLKNFRSWSSLELEFGRKLNLIVGRNAIGKTNILEAVYFLATSRPFPSHQLTDLIKNKEKVSSLVAVLVDVNGYEHLLNINLVLEKNLLRQAFFIGKTKVSRRQFLDEFRALFFEPADLNFIIGSPSRRRRVIDRFLSSVDWQYAQVLATYQKVLRQRNNLLYQIKNGQIETSRLWPWNKSLVKYADYLQKKRQELIDFFNHQQEEAKRTVRLEYQKAYVSLELVRDEKNLRQEIERGMTLWGPHRDDFLFLWNDQPLLRFGSRGQQRLAYLWFFLSQRDWLKKTTQKQPILLLDDLFAELDAEFAGLFRDSIRDDQALITDVEERKLLKEAKIINLE